MTLGATGTHGSQRRPTHRDIARLAGTSQATVSLVLNNRDSTVGISAATRRTVLETARRLGYVADLGARRLRDARAVAAAPELTLAILRPKGTPIGLTARLIEAVSAGLDEHAPTAQVVVEEFTPGRLAEHPGLSVAARFHGALLTSLTPEDEAFLDAPSATGTAAGLPVPVVAFQRRPAAHAWVDVDNVAGAGEATAHLLERGRRRIAAIGWASIQSAAMAARLEGYRQALRAVRGEELVAWAPDLSEQGGAAATEALLARLAADGQPPPDAIFALSDVLAIGVLHALRRAGLRLPQDVAVGSYDDLSFAPFLAPPLTSVRLPYDAMGRAAAAWLVSAARGQAEAPLRRVFQPELVVRESTAPTGATSW